MSGSKVCEIEICFKNSFFKLSKANEKRLLEKNPYERIPKHSIFKLSTENKKVVLDTHIINTNTFLIP